MCEPIGMAACALFFVAARSAPTHIANAAATAVIKSQNPEMFIAKPARSPSPPPKEKRQHKEVIITEKANGNKTFEFIY